MPITFFRIGEKCPRCSGILTKTYQPYEVECPECGLIYDNWTQKEIPRDVYFDAIVRRENEK